MALRADKAEEMPGSSLAAITGWGELNKAGLTRADCLSFSRSASLLDARDAIALEIAQDFTGGIVTRRACDAAARMTSRAAQIKTCNRTPIIRVAQHRPRREDLPKIEGSVEYITAGKAEGSFEIEWGQDLARQY
jgi:hypothetical protein